MREEQKYVGNNLFWVKEFMSRRLVILQNSKVLKAELALKKWVLHVQSIMGILIILAKIVCCVENNLLLVISRFWSEYPTYSLP